MLGLPKGQVFLVEWDKEWARLFEIEKQKIMGLVKDTQIKVHHIGSTSVKDLKSKPILDIAIEIESFNEINEYIEILEEIEYQSIGNGILPERYYFIKGTPRTHQIHLYEKDNQFLKQQIKFRDILLANPDIKESYEKLKLSLASSNSNDKHKYVDLKTNFIKNILEKY